MRNKILLFAAIVAVGSIGTVLAQRPVQPDVNGQSVIGIQGAPVVSTYPQGGQVLSYSTPLNAYQPGAPINASRWPTSCSSPIVQPTGTIWNDSGVLHVC